MAVRNTTRSLAGTPARGRSNNVDEGTREAVIAAALSTICDLGYYQASSNEIARRAGVSWGVIQYYFGSREKLLLAVIDDAVERACASLDQARIVGKDRRMRLRQLCNLVLSFYGRREYAAILQTLWNLARDPRTGQSTEDAVVRHSTHLSNRWGELLSESIDQDLSETAVSMAFDLMWGFAVQEAATAYMDQPVIDATRPPIELRIEMLLDALEGMLDCDRG